VSLRCVSTETPDEAPTECAPRGSRSTLTRSVRPIREERRPSRVPPATAATRVWQVWACRWHGWSSPRSRSKGPQERGRPRLPGLAALGPRTGQTLRRRGRGRPGAPITTASHKPADHPGGALRRDRGTAQDPDRPRAGRRRPHHRLPPHPAARPHPSTIDDLADPDAPRVRHPSRKTPQKLLHAVFTAAPRGGRCAFELDRLGIAARHSRPYHPQTCGKFERLHQTLKRWLARQPRARTVADLQAQLDAFAGCYNTQRPTGPWGDAPPHRLRRPSQATPARQAWSRPPTTACATTPSTPAGWSRFGTTAGCITSAWDGGTPARTSASPPPAGAGCASSDSERSVRTGQSARSAGISCNCPPPPSSAMQRGWSVRRGSSSTSSRLRPC
jgi:Integrase core domain